MEAAMTTRVTRPLLTVLFLAIGSSELEAGIATSIAAGGVHTCALTPVGGVVCWGVNNNGQLGDGTTTDRWAPTPVTGLDGGVVAVSGGWQHTCALTTTGGVLCWGLNGAGELGDGTTSDRHTPTPVAGLGSGVAAIAAARQHTCALKTNGGVVCWGNNQWGQLGDGTTTNRWVPTPVSTLGSGVMGVAAGGTHTCALKTTGGVVCWGDNFAGQVGDGTTADRWTPTPVYGLASGVGAIAAGSYHTCALPTTGGVVCWGDNAYYQLGDGTQIKRLTPTSVSGLAGGVAAVAGGENHTCALTSGGNVVCWGTNDHGQLGDGTQTNRPTPASVTGLGSGVGAIAAGVAHTCAITSAGAAMCWGWNELGQLGDGTTADRQTPTVVLGLFGIPASASDFTGDRQSDILWRHAARGEVWLWPMNGPVKTAETYLRTVSEAGWQIRGQGDQNGDGRANILWRHAPTGMLYLWSIAWWYSIPLIREDYVDTVDPAYDIVGTGDYNGDGKSDILWRHQTNGELWVWLMNGATLVSSTYVMTVDPGYAVVGSGDLNGDGRADIVWRHKTGGDVWVWLMNGATPALMRYVTTVGDLGYQVAGVADHTGDGKADILWLHASRGDVWLWPMDGTTRVAESYVGIVPDSGYRIVGSGDYDGDGKADILWHHATRGEVWVWLMNGAVRVSETYAGSVPDTGYQIVK
jgi:alpha-tubulin suppressor-like RCC1 family protein